MPVFHGVNANSMQALIGELEWLGLPGGQCLFEQGDRDDSLYLIVSGRLGAFLKNEEGRETLVRQMTPGETVGEMALLSGAVRSASVFALRDTEVVRLSRRSFEKLIDEHPRTLRFITDLLVRRLQKPARLAASSEAPKTIAIVPLHPCDVLGFGNRLSAAFAELGIGAVLVQKTSSDEPIEWFSRLEEEFQTVLYIADPEPSAWSQWCLRQADRVLLLTESAQDVTGAWPAQIRANGKLLRVPVDLAVLHDSALLTDAQALKLIDVSEIRLHHHVRRGIARDFRRLARMMTGRAIGLVLSGGGVRGLSHIGVLRALREAGIEIDLFGGVSMGAIIAACAALEWNDDDIYRRLRATFVEKNPLNDYTVPLVALTRGRRLSRTLREHFGDRRIEDCPYTYFCVSSNLGTGRIKVHRNGPVWWANRASVAVPGVLPPVIDGTDVLVDGGVMNNLPVDIMNEMRCGPVIAADVSQESNFHASIGDVEQPPLWRILQHARRGTPNIVTILMAAGSHGSDAILRAMRAQVDLLIQTPLHQFGWLDWKEFDTAVEAGYQSAKKILEEKGEQLFGARDRAILPGSV